MKTRRFIVAAAALAVLSLPAAAPAADMGHGGMHGASAAGRGAAAGPEAAKMGDVVFAGKIGPWTGEARLMDMGAAMAASGMKMQGGMRNSHHVSFAVADPKTKAPVTEGSGTVTVTGPDKVKVKSPLVVMQGHFGADINLPKPGKYGIEVRIESGGGKGSAAFDCTVR